MKTWPSVAVAIPSHTFPCIALCIRFEAARLEDAVIPCWNSSFSLPVALLAREGEVTGLTLGVLTLFHPSTRDKPN